VHVDSNFTAPVAVALPTLVPAAPPASAVVLPAPVVVATVPATALHTCELAMAQVTSTAHIEFATSSAHIEPSSASVLNSLAQEAKKCPGVIQVQGHTDSVGAAHANLLLSQARAQAVRQALLARGLEPQRLQAQGFGAEKPLADNATEQGRSRNRRIEFRLAAGQ
jgi:outer membrane protein OmpA-like peptidoglycan-associated protein